MAIMYSGSLRPDCNNAANVQGWAGWIESVLTTIGGWTVTADTGQTLPSSLAEATGAYQKLGYRIYQMNDEFTEENPIFMRIDYGSGNDQPTYFHPGLWISIGRSTNGAGDLTNVLWDGRNGYNNLTFSTLSTNSASTSGSFVTRNFASADNSRFVLGLFVEPNFIGYSMCFSLERSRDAAGNYTADGLMICFTDIVAAGGGATTQTLSTSLYLVCAGGWQPPLEKSISWIYPTESPSFLIDGAAPVAMITHFKGFAQQPGMQIILSARGNISSEGQLQVMMYGEHRRYQNLGAIWASRPLVQAGNFNDAGIGVCILWE